MEETNYKDMYDELFAKYSDLHREYLHTREENQKLTEKLERFEHDKVYAGERDEKLHAELLHWKTLFTDAERNRQMLAAQMDIVYLIFGKKN